MINHVTQYPNNKSEIGMLTRYSVNNNNNNNNFIQLNNNNNIAYHIPNLYVYFILIKQTSYTPN